MADFTVEGIVVVDVSRGIRDLTRFQKKLKDVHSDLRMMKKAVEDIDGSRIRIDVDIEGQDEFNKLRAEMEEISEKSIEIDVAINGAKALAETEIINAEIDAILDEHKEVTVDVDRKSITALDMLKESASGAASAIAGAGRGALVSAIVLLITTLGPLSAVAAGVAGGVVSAFGAMSAGLGAFAIFAIPTISKVSKALKEMEKATADLKGEAKKAAQIKFLEKLPRHIETIARAILRLKATWGRLAEDLNGPISQALRAWIGAAVVGMRKAAPIALKVAHALRDIGDNTKKSLRADDWKKFFTYVEKHVGKFMRMWAKAFGNIIAGIANMIRAFHPLTKFVSRGFLSMSRDFRKWSAELGKNEGFKDFIKYVKKEGPKIADLIGNIIKGLVQLGINLAPIGEKVLKFINGFFKWYNAWSKANPELSKMVTSLVALSIALTPAIRLFTGMITPILALHRAFGLAAIGVSTFSTNMQTANGRAAVMQGTLTRLGGAARTAAGIAGMAALVSSTQESDTAFSGLKKTIGGALSGFAVGGPWGAAIGTAIGGFSAIKDELDHQKEAAKRAAFANQTLLAQADQLKLTNYNYADSLDTATGALTRKTRAQARDNLVADGALEAARIIGLSTRDVIAAASGNVAATDRVSQAYRKLFNQALNSGNLANVVGLKSAFDQVTTSIGVNAAAVAKSRQELGFVIDKAGKVRRALDDVGKAKPKMDLFMSGVSGAVKSAEKSAKTSASKIKDTLTLDDLRANLAAFMPSLRGELDNIKNAASNGGTNVGNALQQGVLIGFEGTASQLADRARAAVQAAVAAAMKAGKIQSPSKVMRDEVGYELGRGLSYGIDDTLKMIKESSKGLVGEMTGFANTDSSLRFGRTPPSFPDLNGFNSAMSEDQTINLEVYLDGKVVAQSQAKFDRRTGRRKAGAK